jgi:hypothetical protein
MSIETFSNLCLGLIAMKAFKPGNTKDGNSHVNTGGSRFPKPFSNHVVRIFQTREQKETS